MPAPIRCERQRLRAADLVRGEHDVARDETLGCTPGHPFFVKSKGWTLAGKLGVGALVDVDGELAAQQQPREQPRQRSADHDGAARGVLEHPRRQRGTARPVVAVAF